MGGSKFACLCEENRRQSTKGTIGFYGRGPLDHGAFDQSWPFSPSKQTRRFHLYNKNELFIDGVGARGDR
jgi:hypothetical protein